MTTAQTAAADFADPKTCLGVIAALPLTNPSLVHRRLGELLAGMQRTPPGAPDYLHILERARSPLAFAQRELAQRYAGKPLPLCAAARDALRAVVGLWRMMARSYAHVAQLGAGDMHVERRLVLVCQRCIHYSGQAVLEYLRARSEPEPGAWIDLHGYFATVEEWDVADVAVTEPMHEVPRRQSCRDAYCAVLLADLSDPYGRDGHELDLILRWSQRFAPYIDVVRMPPVAGAGHEVDLMGDRGAQPLSATGAPPSRRVLVSSRLAAEMQRVHDALKTGAAPRQLGLGDDCAPLSAMQLLVSLYRPWCRSARARRFPRHAACGHAEACIGFEALHYKLSGGEFNQPEHVRMYSRAEMEEIWTFRDRVDPTHPLAVRSAQVDFPQETWDVLDQSASGFRLRRGSNGFCIEQGQLIGLLPADGTTWLLARVSWQQADANQQHIYVGAHVLPGMPQAVALRGSGPLASPSERYVRAFVMSRSEPLGEAASLVAPCGWFEAERTVEIFTDRPVQLRLVALLARGPDFERISFRRL